MIGIRDRFKVEVDGGDDLKVHGNIVDHEYEIEHDGDQIAKVSKKWFRVRDTYGVEVAPGQDVALILSITVAVDGMTRERDLNIGALSRLDGLATGCAPAEGSHD